MTWIEKKHFDSSKDMTDSSVFYLSTLNPGWYKPAGFDRPGYVSLRQLPA